MSVYVSICNYMSVYVSICNYNMSVFSNVVVILNVVKVTVWKFVYIKQTNQL